MVHLGDVSTPLKPDQVEELTPVDVVFVPVGGGCTVALPQAMDMVRALGPRVVVPMHYSLPGMVVPLGELDAFLREMGAGQVEPQARLNVTPSNLPPELRLVVLNAQGVAGGEAGAGGVVVGVTLTPALSRQRRGDDWPPFEGVLFCPAGAVGSRLRGNDGKGRGFCFALREPWVPGRLAGRGNDG